MEGNNQFYKHLKKIAVENGACYERDHINHVKHINKTAENKVDLPKKKTFQT